MYPAAIAEQLRRRGLDVSAISERPELRSLSDEDLFTVGQSEGRAVVTENIDDFSVIANRADERGLAHFGVVFVSPSAYPRNHERTVGRLVSQLDRLLDECPSDEATGSRYWP